MAVRERAGMTINGSTHGRTQLIKVKFVKEEGMENGKTSRSLLVGMSGMKEEGGGVDSHSYSNRPMAVDT